MTLFGKILIGLILALSLVFASLAAAVSSAQNNYRTRSDSLAQQLADAQSAAQNREAQLQAEVADARAEARRLEDALNLKTGEAEDLAERVRLTEEAANATRTGLDVQTALASLTKTEADARRSEALAQRERNATLSADLTATRGRISELEDELFGLEVAVEQMNAKQNALLDENGALRSALRTRNIDIASALAETSPEPAPKVFGKVVNVQDTDRGNQTYVEISLGSDDGLRARDVLSVFDRTSSKYLGQIELRSVDADGAVGLVTSRSPTGTIQKGNDVSTQL